MRFSVSDLVVVSIFIDGNANFFRDRIWVGAESGSSLIYCCRCKFWMGFVVPGEIDQSIFVSAATYHVMLFAANKRLHFDVVLLPGYFEYFKIAVRKNKPWSTIIIFESVPLFCPRRSRIDPVRSWFECKYCEIYFLPRTLQLELKDKQNIHQLTFCQNYLHLLEGCGQKTVEPRVFCELFTKTKQFLLIQFCFVVVLFLKLFWNVTVANRVHSRLNRSCGNRSNCWHWPCLIYANDCY